MAGFLLRLSFVREEKAVSELLLEHRSRMLRLARRIVRCRHLAEDVVQDVAVSALAALPPQHPRPRAWLLVATRNAALMVLRHRARVPVVKAGYREPASVEGELRTDVRLMLDVLPARLRRAVERRFWHGLSYAEVGEALGVSWQAARGRIRRGIALLRRATAPGPP